MQRVSLYAVTLGFVLLSSLAQATETYSAKDNLSEAEIEQMLAPIALYPDSVLSQVLIAATYPLEVVEANRWARKHPDMQAEDALKAVADRDWDPSVKALVPFPQLLKRMSDNLDWTQRVGDAFLQDESRLLNSIQNLRRRAYTKGDLQRQKQVKVIREEKTIYIEPSTPNVVYVPYYDPYVVYGSWPWRGYPPVFWSYPSYGYGYGYGYTPGLFYWGPRIQIGFGLFYSSFRWHDRRVVVLNRQHYRPYRSGPRAHYYRDARIWRHSPRHRRGVAYQNAALSRSFHSNRPPYAGRRSDTVLSTAALRSGNNHRSRSRRGNTSNAVQSNPGHSRITRSGPRRRHDLESPVARERQNQLEQRLSQASRRHSATTRTGSNRLQPDIASRKAISRTHSPRGTRDRGSNTLSSSERYRPLNRETSRRSSPNTNRARPEIYTLPRREVRQPPTYTRRSSEPRPVQPRAIESSPPPQSRIFRNTPAPRSQPRQFRPAPSPARSGRHASRSTRSRR